MYIVSMSSQFNLKFDQTYLNTGSTELTSQDVVYLKGASFFCQRSWGNLHYSITKFYENKGFKKCSYNISGTDVVMERGFDQLLSDLIITFDVLSSTDIEIVFSEGITTNSSNTWSKLGLKPSTTYTKGHKQVASVLNLSKAAQGYNDLICTDSNGKQLFSVDSHIFSTINSLNESVLHSNLNTVTVKFFSPSLNEHIPMNCFTNFYLEMVMLLIPPNALHQ